MLASSFQLDLEFECDVGVELAVFSSVFRIDSLTDDSKVDVPGILVCIPVSAISTVVMTREASACEAPHPDGSSTVFPSISVLAEFNSFTARCASS
ncbi:hypothetical protein BKH27_07190 [Actinomyces oris]|jgi:hypothetical protein|uniref:Uncharacterized protein n=1 Tax=Actinomyces oris TaxID=544580 RepID=A0A1Q8VXQ8_9ACTO|nr:hypothetical protein [Actinomyces oris]OLO53106.1 hypothetical protein BKH27_07190 [Actinomyces oris]